MDATVFYLSAIVSLVASLLVVTRKNPVHGAVFLVLFFTMISLDFLILRASFLAVIQVLVYAGAIMVLYLFVIMLLSLQPEKLDEGVTRGRKAFAAVASLGLFLLLAQAIRTSPKVQGTPELTAALPAGMPDIGSTEVVGEELFKNQILPFELTSILILIAVIAVIYLTKRPIDTPKADTPQRGTQHSPRGTPLALPELSTAAPQVRETVR